AWPVLLDQLKRGELDLAPGMTPSTQREEHLLFTRPFLASLIGIWVREADEETGTVEDLAGRVVAVEEGYYLADLLAEKYPDVRQLPVASTLEALKAVATNR